MNVRQIPEKRTSFLYIVDMTIQLGNAKCLVVLGISKAHLLEVMARPDFKGLTHQDVEVLSVKILFKTHKEIIEQHLDDKSKQVGIPLQIMEVNGSDLNKGIRLLYR
jgi:hypothetical protein